MATKLSNLIVHLGPRDGYKLKRLAHWCPACNELHPFAVEEPQPNGAQWRWNGDAYHPSFEPSMSISYGGKGSDADVPRYHCHYYLKAGHLQYLGDSTHALAGQTVPLPEIPAGELSRLAMNEVGPSG